MFLQILRLLGEAKYMSAFDMSNGFHAVKVAAEDIEKAAFSTHKGQWEWVRIRMELINSPATYSRMMNFKLRGLIGKSCFVYLNNSIFIGRTLEEHLKNIRTVCDRLRETNLMLNPDKCMFLQRELEYLGHRVTPQGIMLLERYVEKVLKFPQPRNKEELERFVGLASYYRKFIKDFSKCTYNLNGLESKNVVLSEYPIIAHPNTSKPLILHTDASNLRISETLLQICDDNLEHLVAFVSLHSTRRKIITLHGTSCCPMVHEEIQKINIWAAL